MADCFNEYVRDLVKAARQIETRLVALRAVLVQATGIFTRLNSSILKSSSVGAFLPSSFKISALNSMLSIHCVGQEQKFGVIPIRAGTHCWY